MNLVSGMLLRFKRFVIPKYHKLWFNKVTAQKLGLKENTILLARFSSKKSAEWISKIMKNKYGYYARLGERVLKEEGIRDGDTVDMEILKKCELDAHMEPHFYDGKLDLTSFMKKGHFGFFEKRSGKILIYSYPHSSILIKRFVDLNGSLPWLIGFYLAEGNMTNVFGVCNTNPDLLMSFKRGMELEIGVNETLWRVEISANRRLTEDELKKYWSKELCIGKERVVVYFKKIKINSDFGVARLDLARSRPLLKIWLNMCFDSKVLKNILLNNILAKNFLFGFEAGDGYVSSYKTKEGWNKLEVGIQQKKNERIVKFISDVYSRLYGRPKTSWSENKGTKVYYNDCRKIRDFILDDHFCECERQRRKLIEGYARTKFGKCDLKYLKSLENKSVNELSEHLGLTVGAVHEKLHRSMKLELVKRNKKYGMFRYVLTNKGKYLLKCLLSVGESNEKNVLHKNLRMPVEQVGLDDNRGNIREYRTCSCFSEGGRLCHSQFVCGQVSDRK
jgi:DNA-binding HxlR family transcriptional regulator